ncbi:MULTISPECIES: winged helix-turn-helix domain-containing protein [unclassified Coleofasciculus]|uniref:winged helix-turn-helix domain-containing protein n=1 Tax=unclassified Coleofasciculus TaxID=2692782 RepID=UPI0018814EF5|nr:MULTISPECIES: winged helix-turn-helix domain-containing protein [unclassified Coleofasciculus]MBE9127659.1 winged helix-turn-helix domain-containing protein [Coleofasciculus sp. LEGE 07081]MBE9150997.1 winged helix-turn-helix domain-containing protein [Coleofasciculus sp. LEGE 07092]
MEKRTVAQAVIEVLQAAKEPMTISDITQAILDQNLYTFNAKEPSGIVRGAIERRCEGLNRKDSIKPKYFKKLSEGKYGLIEVEG